MNGNVIKNNDYKNFLVQIKNQIIQSRNNAMKFVNSQLIMLYWDIGKQIFEKQQISRWGDGIINNLSKDLSNEF